MPVAPYKIEAPLPLVLPVPASVVVLPPAAPAKVATAKRGRKPKVDSGVEKETAAKPVKKPAAMKTTKTKKA